MFSLLRIYCYSYSHCEAVSMPFNKQKTYGCVTEPEQNIIKHHEIATAVRVHKTLKQIPVHRKDKVEVTSQIDFVYQIPCKTLHR